MLIIFGSGNSYAIREKKIYKIKNLNINLILPLISIYILSSYSSESSVGYFC